MLNSERQTLRNIFSPTFFTVSSLTSEIVSSNANQLCSYTQLFSLHQLFHSFS